MTRTDYQNQARQFLNNCSATMSIAYVGKAKPDWDNKNHNMYTCIIKTQRGQMTVNFYDSIANTMNGSKPTEYDILACLQKYDVGEIEEFIDEFGYEIKKKGDLKRIMNTYHAVVKEYHDVCRCFTQEQIEAMREIQ